MKKITLTLFTKFLSLLARFRLSKNKPLIVGVTWSVGKTSCRVIVAQTLSKLLPQESVYTSSKNFNSEIGISLSILWIESFKPTFDGILTTFFESLRSIIIWSHKASLIVLEYGIDMPGDMKRLLDIVTPDIAILTTIDSVHAANFPNGKDDIEIEKIQLLKAAKDTILYDPSTIKNTTLPINSSVTTITYSSSPWAWDIFFSDYQLSLTKNLVWSSFVYHSGSNSSTLTITSTLVGVHNISYMCVGITIADIISHRKTQPSLRTQQVINIPAILQPWRFTLFTTWSEDIIIDSTYNASPSSMRTILKETQELKQLFFHDHVIVAVLWEMRELWDISQKEHRDLWERLSKSTTINYIIWVSGDSVYMTDYLIGLQEPSKHINRVWSTLEVPSILLQQLQFIRKENPLQKCIIIFKSSQGEIYLEESIKPYILPEQRSMLPRQEWFWINKKQFVKKLFTP